MITTAIQINEKATHWLKPEPPRFHQLCDFLRINDQSFDLGNTINSLSYDRLHYSLSFW